MTDTQGAGEPHEIPDAPPAKQPTEPVGAPIEKPLEKPVDWKSIAVRLGPAGPWALISATLPAIMGLLLVFVFIQDVGLWLREHETLGIALFILAFAITSGFALLPTFAQAVVGGWAFGLEVGFPAALLGFLGGSMIGYEMGRLTSGDRVVRIIDEHPKWKAVADTLVHSGFVKTLLIVALLRAPPNSPFALTNLVLSATKTRRLPYFLGTATGMAPRTVAYVVIGRSAEELSREGIDKPTWMIVGGIVSTIIVVVVIGWIANKAVTRVTTGKRRIPNLKAGPTAGPTS